MVEATRTARAGARAAAAVPASASASAGRGGPHHRLAAAGDDNETMEHETRRGGGTTVRATSAATSLVVAGLALLAATMAAAEAVAAPDDATTHQATTLTDLALDPFSRRRHPVPTQGSRATPSDGPLSSTRFRVERPHMAWGVRRRSIHVSLVPSYHSALRFIQSRAASLKHMGLRVAI